MKSFAFLVVFVLTLFALPAIASAHHEDIGICHFIEKNKYDYVLADADGFHADHKNDIFNVAGPEVCAGSVVETALEEPEESLSPTVHTSESNWSPSPAKTPPADVYECNDFATQADAQKLYDLYHTEFGDFANLDPNGNGIACEKDEKTTASPTISPSIQQEDAELPKTGTVVTFIIVVSLILLSVGTILVMLALARKRKIKS